MRSHLRADKVEFWARLIPAVWQLRKQRGALLGDDARCPAGALQSTAWILGWATVVLVVLLVVFAILAARYRCQYRRLSVSVRRQDSVAKV